MIKRELNMGMHQHQRILLSNIQFKTWSLILAPAITLESPAMQSIAHGGNY